MQIHFLLNSKYSIGSSLVFGNLILFVFFFQYTFFTSVRKAIRSKNVDVFQLLNPSNRRRFDNPPPRSIQFHLKCGFDQWANNQTCVNHELSYKS